MTGLYRVESVEATWALAKSLAKELRQGDVVCLEGDLGAGKTTFTQGLAAALGLGGRVTSPTFCIVREHSRPPSDAPASSVAPSLLVHMDLYRLSGEEDVEAIGWDDYLARGAVIVVEWPDRAGSLIPSDAWHLSFRHIPGPENREISIARGC